MGQNESHAYDFANEWSGDIWSRLAETLTVIEHWDGSVEYPSDCISLLRFGNDFIYVGYDRNPERFMDDDRIVAELAPDDEEGLQAWSEETEYLESVPESHGMTPEEWNRHLVEVNTTAEEKAEEEQARDDVRRCRQASRHEPIMMGFHRIDFNDDEAVEEAAPELAAAIVNNVRELGTRPTGKKPDGPAIQIMSIGGVAVPRKHRGSHEEAEAWLADRTRRGNRA